MENNDAIITEVLLYRRKSIDQITGTLILIQRSIFSSIQIDLKNYFCKLVCILFYTCHIVFNNSYCNQFSLRFSLIFVLCLCDDVIVLLQFPFFKYFSFFISEHFIFIEKKEKSVASGISLSRQGLTNTGTFSLLKLSNIQEFNIFLCIHFICFLYFSYQIVICFICLQSLPDFVNYILNDILYVEDLKSIRVT